MLHLAAYDTHQPAIGSLPVDFAAQSPSPADHRLAIQAAIDTAAAQLRHTTITVYEGLSEVDKAGPNEIAALFLPPNVSLKFDGTGAIWRLIDGQNCGLLGRRPGA